MKPGQRTKDENAPALIGAYGPLLVVVAASLSVLAALATAMYADEASREQAAATAAARGAVEEIKKMIVEAGGYDSLLARSDETHTVELMRAELNNRLSAAPDDADDINPVRLKNARGEIHLVRLREGAVRITAVVNWHGALGAASATVQTDLATVASNNLNTRGS